MARRFKALAVAAAQAASDKKGDAIVLLRPGRRGPLSEYLLIVTANSRPHLEVLEDAIRIRAKTLGFHCLHRARPASDRWRVLDFGGVLAHVMTDEARSFYALDKLYADSLRVAWGS